MAEYVHLSGAQTFMDFLDDKMEQLLGDSLN